MYALILSAQASEELEVEADAMLDSAEKIAADAAYANGDRYPRLILTTSMVRLRSSREVFTASGTPDAAMYRGIYGRELNFAQPWLNSRPHGRRVTSNDEESHYERYGTLEVNSRVPPAWRSSHPWDSTYTWLEDGPWEGE